MHIAVRLIWSISGKEPNRFFILKFESQLYEYNRRVGTTRINSYYPECKDEFGIYHFGEGIINRLLISAEMWQVEIYKIDNFKLWLDMLDI